MTYRHEQSETSSVDWLYDRAYQLITERRLTAKRDWLRSKMNLTAVNNRTVIKEATLDETQQVIQDSAVEAGINKKSCFCNNIYFPESIDFYLSSWAKYG